MPFARANLSPIPDDLSDEEVLLVPDIFSTGLGGAEAGNIRVGDAVAIFAQGPIGLCATLARSCAGRRSSSASMPIHGDSRSRSSLARTSRSTIRDGDPVVQIKALTDGRGVDVAIEALGQQTTFENALRATRAGGTLSSLGVYSGKLVAPYEAIYAGLGDQRSSRRSVPAGTERMRRLMAMMTQDACRSDAPHHAPFRSR